MEVDGDGPLQNHEGIKQYYSSKIESLQLVVTEKTQNLRRLEAQRNELNAKVRMLREELQLLQEQGSYVGEVVKPMDKKKVLVKNNMIMCILLEKGGFTSTSTSNITSPIGPSLSKPDRLYQHGDLLSKPLMKLSHKENSQLSLGGSLNGNHTALRRIFQKRKDSVGSDNSHESSGDSVFKMCQKASVRGKGYRVWLRNQGELLEILTACM